jgi:AcrR family transcriptional regulator
VEQVGVREIARALGMRPGHVTYYFPDKDALVLELTTQLRALNDNVKMDGSVRTVDEFMARFERILRNHIAYRGLLLSMGRMMSALPKVKAQYRATQAKRVASLRACFGSLAEAGELRPLARNDVDFLVSCCSLISRGWVAESLAAGFDLEARVSHYVALLRTLMRLYERDR